MEFTFMEIPRWWIAEGCRNPGVHDFRKILQSHGNKDGITEFFSLLNDHQHMQYTLNSITNP
jgi:hypothetical protein